MTGGRDPGEHWLDRLAVGYTRRQVLARGALVGAGMALPFLRARGARAALADTPTSCQKGCLYTSHRQAADAVAGCRQLAVGVAFTSLAYFPLIGIAGGLPGVFANELNSYRSCADRSLLNAKARNWDCLQPNCPGFDPKAAGGPCDTCDANCCADPNVEDGYSCCLQCSQAGGCCYSVSGQC